MQAMGFTPLLYMQKFERVLPWECSTTTLLLLHILAALVWDVGWLVRVVGRGERGWVGEGAFCQFE